MYFCLCFVQRSFLMFIMFCGLFLSGCANKNQELLNYDKRYRNIAEVSSWKLQGKFYVKDAQTSYIAGLEWSNYKNETLIKVFNDFGLDVLKIETSKSYAKITDENGTEYIGDNLNDIIYKHSSLYLPVAQMQKWLIGLPFDHNAAYIKHGTTTNTTAQIEESGWVIGYSQYKNYNGLLMPMKIDCRSEQMHLKIKVREWLFLN